LNSIEGATSCGQKCSVYLCLMSVGTVLRLSFLDVYGANAQFIFLGCLRGPC